MDTMKNLQKKLPLQDILQYSWNEQILVNGDFIQYT